MIIGSISENISDEQRVAITPDIIKKYKSLGLEVHLSKDYAKHIGISDQEYEEEGASISDSSEIISNSNAILQMNILNDENLRLKISNAGFELAKKHTYTKRVEKLIEFYEVTK